MPLPQPTPDELRSRRIRKWDDEPGMLGAWIAEADFGVAPPIRRSLERLTADEMLTYTPLSMIADLRAATAEYMERRYRWRIEPAAVEPVPDVLMAFLSTLDSIADPDAPVVLLTPAYMPFFTTVRSRGRRLIEVDMIRAESGWELDLPALEDALAGGGVLVLCSPHNPIGKVYSHTELEAISEIVDRTGSLVFADEIHAPLVLDGQHIPYASVSVTAAAHSVTATSASKTYNIPGLKCAQMIFTNPEHRRLWSLREGFLSGATALPGIVANIAAYRECDDWLAELLEQIRSNRDLVRELLPRLLPKAEWADYPGTYLVWIDLRPYGLAEEAAAVLRERAGVALTNGIECGTSFGGWVRLNTATPAPILTEIIERIAAALES